MSTATPEHARLSDHELAMFSNLPETDIIDLAAELYVPIPECIRQEELLAACVVQLADLAKRDGLPFSPYDKDDLTELSIAHRGALAAALQVDNEVAAILKSGIQVYRTYRRTHPRSQIALMMPMLLGALARYLSHPA